jgi:hypothetical protein
MTNPITYRSSTRFLLALFLSCGAGFVVVPSLAQSGAGAAPAAQQDQGDIGPDGQKRCTGGSPSGSPPAGKTFSTNYTWKCPNGCSWDTCGHSACGEKWLCVDAPSAPSHETPPGAEDAQTEPRPADAEKERPREPADRRPKPESTAAPKPASPEPPPGSQLPPWGTGSLDEDASSRAPFDKHDPSDFEEDPGGLDEFGRDVLDSAKEVLRAAKEGLSELADGIPAAVDSAGKFARDAAQSGDIWGYVVDHSTMGDQLFELKEQMSGLSESERRDMVTDFLLETAEERYDLETERGWLRLTGDVESVLSLGLGGSAARGGAEAAGGAVDAARGAEAGVGAVDVARGAEAGAGAVDVARGAEAGAGAVDAARGAEVAGARITVSEDGLAHALEGHTYVEGRIPVGDSVFFEGTDIRALIWNAESTAPVLQERGNFERIVDAGHLVGFNRDTGMATSVYTVITKPNGEFVTMFVGRPTVPVGPLGF